LDNIIVFLKLFKSTLKQSVGLKFHR